MGICRLQPKPMGRLVSLGWAASDVSSVATRRSSLTCNSFAVSKAFMLAVEAAASDGAGDAIGVCIVKIVGWPVCCARSCSRACCATPGVPMNF